MGSKIPIQKTQKQMLNVLDDIKFDKVIFLIGSSNHHEINKKVTMGLDFNVYPIKKILTY